MVRNALFVASFIATISMLLTSSVKAQTTEYFYKSTVVESSPAPQTIIYREAQVAEPITVVETQPTAVVVEKMVREPAVVQRVVVKPVVVEKVKVKKHRHNTLMRLGTLPLRVIF